MKFMLDTNTCIYLINKKSPKIFVHFKRCTVGEIGISSITLAKLEYGVSKSQHAHQNKLALREFILPLEISFFDNKAAEVYGEIRSYLEKAGKPIGAMDTLIAAHALNLDVTLVTNNVSEFRRIKNLKITDWTI